MKDALKRPVAKGDGLGCWWGGPDSIGVAIGTDSDGPVHTIAPNKVYAGTYHALRRGKKIKSNDVIGPITARPDIDLPNPFSCDRVLKCRPPGTVEQRDITATRRHIISSTEGSHRGYIYRKLHVRTEKADFVTGRKRYNSGGIEIIIAPIGVPPDDKYIYSWLQAVARLPI